MIRTLNRGEHLLAEIDSADFKSAAEKMKGALWIDLHDPTAEETQLATAALNIDLPSHDEMHEIEESSRLFERDGQLFMFCWLHCYEVAIPTNMSVGFVATKDFLLSIRHSDHHALRLFTGPTRRKNVRGFKSPDAALVELLESVIGHIASTLRLIEQDLNVMSLEVFSEPKGDRKLSGPGGLKSVIQRLGRRNALVSSLRESSLSISNLLPFFVSNAAEWLSPTLTSRLRVLERDILSLREYDTQLGAEINFLLDSTVGLIGIDQNQSMKILSVAAVLLALI